MKGSETMTAAQKLIQMLNLGEKDAVVVHNPSNMMYLTQGYTGEGLVYISTTRQVIVTDFRYTEQAERQSTGFEVVMTDKGLSHSDWVARLVKDAGVENIRYEDNYLTVKDFAVLKDTVGENVAFLPLNSAPETLREIKEDFEIASIRKACDITTKTFMEILGKIHEGMTEKELQIELDFTKLRLGAEADSFKSIVASGENGSLCHAIPGERKLRYGDMITMDFGCLVNGYCSDMTRTVALGQPSAQMLHVYNTVLTAQQMCEDALAPGKKCSDIDKIARDYIDSQGYAGRFGHGLGHSLGIDIHENPRLSYFCHDITKPGHVLTVEPGVYLPGIGGVRIENTCLVTETGCEPLTHATKELIIL